MAALFDFIVQGIPRSRQTSSPKSRNDWKERVRKALLERWVGDLPPLELRLSAVVIYFYREQTNLDVDSIGKYVLDQLNGIAVRDDSLFDQVIFRKTDQSAIDELIEPSPLLSQVYRAIGNFVYVAVASAPDHRRIPI